jgi:hypothetical protein
MEESERARCWNRARLLFEGNLCRHVRFPNGEQEELKGDVTLLR